MKRRKIKISRKLLLVAILLAITIGYAYLNTSLTINGVSKIANSKWDIHFENVVVNENSVAIGEGDSAAVVNSSDNTEVTYSVSLDKPGDYYEFNVDVKNFGTIDGMIEEITSILKINDAEPITIADDNSNLPAYLDYSITYSDDIAIEDNHELKAGEKETYKVRIEFKRDISSSDLPTTVQTLTLNIRVVYVQADENAVQRSYPEIAKYSTQTGIVHFLGDNASNFGSPDYDSFIRRAFIKYVLNSDNIVIRNDVCFKKDNQIYCLKGLAGEDGFQENQTVIMEAFGQDAVENSICSISSTSISCKTEDFKVTIYKSSGFVSVFDRKACGQGKCYYCYGGTRSSCNFESDN